MREAKLLPPSEIARMWRDSGESRYSRAVGQATRANRDRHELLLHNEAYNLRLLQWRIQIEVAFPEIARAMGELIADAGQVKTA